MTPAATSNASAQSRFLKLIGLIAGLCLVLTGLTGQSAQAAEEPGHISGTVLDASGNPLEGVDITFSLAGGDGSGWLVQTDAEGHYSSADRPEFELAPGSYTVIAAKHPAHNDDVSPGYRSKYWPNATTEAGSTPVTVTAGQTHSGVDFQLTPSPGIRLTVKDPSGVPMPNVGIGIWTFVNGAWEPYAAGPNLTNDNGVYYKMARLGDGYKFRVIPPSGVDAVTEWYSDKYSEAEATPVEITQESQAINITLQLGAKPEVQAGTPTITGTPEVGKTLTANPGTWSPSNATLSHQWYAGDTAVGTDATTYVPAVADAGKVITVKVTGTKTDYTTASATSAATAAVATAAMTASTPTITGTPKVGETLTADPGTWTPGDVALSYQWYAGDTAVGTDATTYVPTADDAGKVITVKVTGAKAGYTTTSATSVATATVQPLIGGAVPLISGTVRSGSTLTANPGTWSPTGVTLTYQWYASGVPISGATGTTFRLSNTQATKQMSVAVTGTSGTSFVTKESLETVPVVGVMTTRSISIAGTRKVGYRLRADTDRWVTGATLKYRWYRNGHAISGQTSRYLRLTRASAGKRISVRVTQSKSGYLTATRLSPRTATIRR